LVWGGPFRNPLHYVQGVTKWISPLER
jgi:hypothetical protein